MGAVDGLYDELRALEGTKGQNPETGQETDASFISSYTNRLFGAPYQLLDSVDKRFGGINSGLGNEYMRNFIFNSPILYVKPGMPIYTGNIQADSIGQALKDMYMDTTVGGMSTLDSIMMSVGGMLMSDDGDYQRRMFGFKETYYTYMQHVNYMLHNIANLMGLTGGKYPSVMFGSSGRQDLASAKWENYRMMGNQTAQTPTEQLMSIMEAYVDTPINVVGNAAVGLAGDIHSAAAALKNAGASAINAANKDNYSSSLEAFGAGAQAFVSTLVSPSTAAEMQEIQDRYSEVQAAYFEDSTVAGVMSSKVTSVQFMVDPVSFEESHSNEIGQSMIGGAISGLDTIGQELQWLSNSHVDAGILEGVYNFVGGAGDALGNVLRSATNVLGGSFISNLFDGAVKSLKGQKMLYPQIYKSSSSSMNYNFSMTLTSPYGDPYNYYMNIIVPLIHLIALVAPRAVNANAISSPYLVQAFIPGMCTCQLGIITNMQIDKNPNVKHVSVDGYPLTVKVTFTISELYNNLSISPANNPASFLYNETLNDYMCNLAGLIPSIDMFAKQRMAMKAEYDQFFSTDRINDISQMALESVENFNNPYIGR